jgi:predicted ATPase
MTGKTFLKKLKLQNFLSYGSVNEEIELQPLNVLIGPNFSGKSNLIEAIALLRATPTDLQVPFRKGGGSKEFLWKGDKNIPIASLQAVVDYPNHPELLYQLDFTVTPHHITYQQFELVEEWIGENHSNRQDFCYHYHRGQGADIRVHTNPTPNHLIHLSTEELLKDQSILSQRRDPHHYQELSYLSQQLPKIGLYRHWQVGPNVTLRMAQPADLPKYPLEESGCNLGLALNHLQYQLGSKTILEHFQKFYPTAEELSINVRGGAVDIFIREEGQQEPISAVRLSDGTLHYLFLMTLLLDPTPPPLLCIEEPELGIHPDRLSLVADLLVEASQKTQIMVTTQSDVLVSALSEYTDSVVICERDETGSHLHRLESGLLTEWLENYTLGEIWMMGQIGGKPW